MTQLATVGERTREGVMIPVEIFRDRTLSVLEVITEYLKEQRHLNYHQIAELLNRDDRTIWTCYYRAKQKRAKAMKEKQLDLKDYEEN